MPILFNENSRKKKLLDMFFKDEKIISNTDLIKALIDYVNNSNLYLTNLNISIHIDENKPAHYNPNNKTVNIPLKVTEKTNIGITFSEIEKDLKKDAFSFLVCHEIGHAVQHSSIGSQDIRFQPVKFDKSSNLDYLFNGPLSSKPINIFLQKNYQEIYADCYAGYCLYKLNQDINIFEHIQRFRINQKNNYKKANPSLYHEYYETYAIEFFKKELLNKPTINNYNDIHDLINKSIIKGIFKTVLEEVETNDSILKAINEFAYEFNKAKPLKGFFERLYNANANNG